MHPLIKTLSEVIQSMLEDIDMDSDSHDKEPPVLDVSYEHLVKINQYLEVYATLQAEGKSMTPHDFPLRPSDYLVDPRIIPKFETTFEFPESLRNGENVPKLTITEDKSYTLESVIRGVMEKAKYTPFEIDFVATSDLDEAHAFCSTVSYMGMKSLAELASIPVGVWSFFFPTNPWAIMAYFGIEGDMRPEDRVKKVQEVQQDLGNIYK